MAIQVILKKFSIDLKLLDEKLKKLNVNKIGLDKFSGRLILDKPVELDEFDKVFFEERAVKQLQWDLLRRDLNELKDKLGSYNLEIKTYANVRIPKSTIKKKIAKLGFANGKINLLLEILKDNGKYFYRLFTMEKEEKTMDKKLYHNLSVILENPRLVDELSDFLRLCLIFDLNFDIIYDNKREASALIGKAKKITKGKLSDFNVNIYNSLKDVKNVKIGFSKHAKKNEKDLKKFLLANKNVTLVFGNDTYGLSQDARDSCDELFHLTPDNEKPLKANQALSYVLGLYNGWFQD